MSWESLKEVINKKGGGGEDYIKLKDGESVTGAFVGEPITFYQAFKDIVEYTSWAEGRSFNFKCNFALLENKKFKIKLLHQRKTLLKNIVASIERYGQENLFEIKREGSGKEDTTYHVFFVGKLTDEDKKAIAALNPFKLYLRDGNPKEDELDFPPIEVAEDGELKTDIVNRLVDLVGPSAKDIEDFLEYATEFKGSDGKVVKGIRQPEKLSYVIKPGKKMSQAAYAYEKIAKLTKAEAEDQLKKRRGQ